MNCRIREFLTYDYKDPAAWLRSMREIEPLITSSALGYKARSLRTRTLRQWGHARHAALFAFGMSQRMPGFVFDFALVERQDYDAVIRWRNATDQMFAPLQLKEYVPKKLNLAATLGELTEKLEKYVNSAELVVCIYLNRRFRFDANSVRLPRSKLGGIYFVAAATPTRNYWHLVGDVLGEQSQHTVFAHP